MIYTKIKIKAGGCGVKYKDENGVERFALKTPEDGAFNCEIEQAKRFVALGAAEFVADGDSKALKGGKVSGHLSAEQLEEMNYNELKKLAADMGVKATGNKKENYIAAIVAAEVEADADDVVDDADDLPDLGAVDPE